jgi:hypothetical protein
MGDDRERPSPFDLLAQLRIRRAHGAGLFHPCSGIAGFGGRLL